MKAILLLCTLLSNTTFAQDFLSPSESKKVATYLDDICPDTYCAGDINYYVHSMDCAKNTCQIDMTAKEYYVDYFDIQNVINTIGLTSTAQNILTTSSSYSYETEEDGSKYYSVKGKCKVTVLEDYSTWSYDDKQEYIYQQMIDGCIHVYNYFL